MARRLATGAWPGIRIGRAVGLALGLVLGFGPFGCSRASPEGEARQWATPPPGKDIAIPASLHIALAVDGAARPAITSASLGAAQPDFADDEHKAWLISTLAPEARSVRSSIEAVSGTGVSVKFARPTADGLEPVLFLTRRGDVIVSALDPKDPFPRYHGQGGRLRRAGDPMPRLAAVSRIEITHTMP
jgi:3',5'-cyclic AMP phosphodiesterase CpdA